MTLAPVSDVSAVTVMDWTLFGIRIEYLVCRESMTHRGFAELHRAGALLSHPLTHLGHARPPICVEFTIVSSSYFTCSSLSVELVTVESTARVIPRWYFFLVTPSPAVTSNS